MINFSAPLSGMRVARQGLDLVSTNLSNAQTPGYHRQSLDIEARRFPSASPQVRGGAEVGRIQRQINRFVEREITSQRTGQGSLSQQEKVLSALESALGEVGSSRVAEPMTEFFNAMGEIPAQPNDKALQQQAVSEAEGLGRQFRELAGSFERRAQDVRARADEATSRINELTKEIADLNGKIANLNQGKGATNILLDQRDQAINELAELAPVDTRRDADLENVRNVSIDGMSVVFKNRASELRTDLDENGDLGVTVKGAEFFRSVEGGELGGLLSLANERIPRFRDALDRIAGEVIRGVNDDHLEGLGGNGSFEKLTGARTIGDPTAALGDQLDIEAGSFHVRVLDTSSGDFTRSAVSVSPSDSLNDVVSKINTNVSNVNAGVVDQRLELTADSGFRFDFTREVTPDPQSSSLTGTASPKLEGTFQGAQNENFTFTVNGSGQVGSSPGLSLEVTNAAGDPVKTIDVGEDYTPGSLVEVEDGVRVSISDGTLNNGESFSAEALADSDNSGFLAAAGMNTLFTGTSAARMEVREDVAADPGNLAVHERPEGTDGRNALRISKLVDEARSALGGNSLLDEATGLSGDLGQEVASLQARQKASQSTLEQLQQRRDEASGVDLNQEAARMLQFEQMFQGIARHLRTQQEVLDTLANIV